MTEHSQRPSKEVWVDHFEPLQVWRFPFRLENILLTAPFIFLWSFLLGSFYVGGFIMVARSALAIYATVGFFFCYLFIVLDFTARGYQTPPKIGGDLLNANKGRFIKGLALSSMFASIAYTAAFSETLFVLTIAITALFLPVAVCIIAIQDSFINAMSPVRWYGFFRDIRFDRYFWQYLTTLGLAGLSIMLLQQDAGWLNLVTMSCCVFSFVLMFRCLGVLVHTNADGLGLSVRFGPEIEAAQRAENDQRALSDFALGLYQQVEVGRVNAAFDAYEKKLKEDKYSQETALWITIKEWPSPGT
jgi:hypothetical protein